jgi:glyoxylase-like metal-dependent hydrolase (beta-lactamase superfamily II)
METMAVIIQKRVFKILAVITLIVTGTSIPMCCFSNDGVKVNVKKITENVAVYNIEGVQATNITVFDTDEGLVVIDTELSPIFARAVKDKIEETNPDTPIRYLINTHDHGDHTWGNQVFTNATIIGHERCKDEMIKKQARTKQTGSQMSNVVKSMYAKLENTDKNSDAAEEIRKVIAYYEPVVTGLGEQFVLTPPEITFSDKLNLDLGNTTLSLIYFGGLSHSYSDILIHCPEEKLLMTGDLFYEGSELYLDSERIQCIDKWKQTLETVLKDTSQIRFVVPGHGKLMPVSLLIHNLEFITEKQKEYAGKESALFVFKDVYETKGLESSIKKMKILYSDPEHYYFLYPEFDTFAYRLMLADKLSDAIEIFEVLAEYYPESYIAFDSLGEAHMRKGDKEKAKEYFSKSLELNPKNQNAKNRIAELK